MHPTDIVLNNPETTWCLADPSRSYLVYTLNGGEIKLDLSDAQGSFLARWFDPRTGRIIPAAAITGGKSILLKTPDEEDWVLWIRAKR
ncbi:hypothetical protein J7M22_14340 [Candidatus Poribacteria bacterium]|nr:hypothetical protein [Candidatus Poribacteria bacterium]